MKVISTYSSTNSNYHEGVNIEEFILYRDREYENEYDFERGLIEYWEPGNDIYVSVKLSVQADLAYKPFLNWYCTANHIRNALLDDEQERSNGLVHLKGRIDGDKIRDGLKLKVLLYDENGYTLDTGIDRKIDLEGKKGLFPYRLEAFDQGEHALCRLELDTDIDPEELFNISTCCAVFNTRHRLFHEETGRFINDQARYFAFYEINRQLLEISLQNTSFEEFMYSEEDEDDLRIGVVWTRILTSIFPGKSLDEIGNLYKNRYSHFCSMIQSRCLSAFNLGE